MVSYMEDHGCLSNGCSTQIALEVVDFHLLSKLPEQVLVEILIRLPSDSACRFKAVCKKWWCLISSKYFVRSYLDYRCQDTPKSFTLVLAITTAAVWSPRRSLTKLNHVEAVSNHRFLSNVLESKSFNSSMRYQFNRVYKRNNVAFPYQQQQQPRQRREFYVEASCHDLLLLSDSFTYCVVNMHTTKFIMVPPAPVPVGTPCQRKAGLLCCHKYGDRCCRFKLILVPSFSSSGILEQKKSSTCSIDIYSSETREWSVVNVRRYPLKLYGFLHDTPIISHDRMLYWINTHSLVSVDPFLGDGQLKVAKAVELPKKHFWLLLGVCCGRIRLVGLVSGTGKLVLHVWDLDNDKLWLLSHNIMLGKKYERKFMVLAIHPYDSDVLFVRKADVIYMFNMRTDILEEYHKIEVKDSENRMVVGSAAAVVLHQWFPTPIPSRNRAH